MKRLLTCLVLAASGGVSTTLAHEILTHQQISDAAVSYLQQIAGDRPAWNELRPLLRVGAVQEDDEQLQSQVFPYGRYFFHFLPALDALGSRVSASCTSVQWGILGSACIARCAVMGCSTQTTLPQINVHGFTQSQSADAITGRPSVEATKNIGYVVHLLEDLGSPAHSRNDLHPCEPRVDIPFPDCDTFHLINNGRIPRLPSGPPVLSPDAFSSAPEFFDSLRSFVSANYYSDDTVFAPTQPGPVSVAEDARYFYGSCIPIVSSRAGTCRSVGGQLVRKIAHKGPLFLVSCRRGQCDRTLARIDATIAQEQYDELGPVMVEYVAAFLKFWTPLLTVQTQGLAIGRVRSNYEQISNCALTCRGLFLNGDTVTLTAEPTDLFTGWTGDCQGSTNPLEVPISGRDMTCVAHFGDAPGPSLRLNPSGDRSLSEGPFRIEVVRVEQGQLVQTQAPESINVTLSRVVVSQCNGVLFSSNRTVTIAAGAALGGSLDAAGRDPSCNTLPIVTRWTLLQAVFGAGNVQLDLSVVPAAERELAITR